jgi:group I intron endonuclease
MIGIYKITSPSGKIYIGQSIDIERRFNGYKKRHCKSQPKLNRSFVKYKPENHKFEIIKECNVYELNDYERYYQDFYNVLSSNGLNCILTILNENKRKSFFAQKEKVRKENKDKVIRKKITDIIDSIIF